MVGSHPAATGDSPRKQSALAEPLAQGVHKHTDGPDQASDGVATSLIFGAVALPLRTSVCRPLGLDIA